MSFGSISNLYVIGRYLFSSFLTDNFRSTGGITDLQFKYRVDKDNINPSGSINFSNLKTKANQVQKIHKKASVKITIIRFEYRPRKISLFK